ncbi:MAG TPA: thrombospondin type 3 repeat-containing protein [Nocardioides sp.]|nr:thrombospondin type 3 repeat-containing protein [Nocardioides sp.]
MNATTCEGVTRDEPARPNRLRIVASVAVSSTLVLSGAGLMLAFPGEAAPLPTSYSARTSADLWHVNAFDADLSDGTPATATDLSVFQVDGLVDSTTDPRSRAEAYNLAGSTANGENSRRGVVSSALPDADTANPTAGIAPSGVIANLLNVDQSTLSARARWVGDVRCLSTADGLADSSAAGGAASLAPSVIPSGTVGPPIVGGGSTTLPTALPTQTVSGLPTSLPSSPSTSVSSTTPTSQSPTSSSSTALPTELPTSATSSVPTSLPTSTTSLPTVLPSSATTLPTVLPTTTLPTVLPTTTTPSVTVTATPTSTSPLPTLPPLPSVPLTTTPTLSIPPVTTPTIPIPGFPRAQAAGGVVLASVSPGTVRSRTDLPVQNDATADVRGVRAETVGTVQDTTAPAMTFFGGEVEVRIGSEARLTAYADGLHPSVVAWSPPTVSVTVAGQPTTYFLAANGTPLVVSYSQNSGVTLTLTAGQLTTTAQSANGLVAAGTASVMHMVVAKGGAVALDADYLPMSAEAKAPAGGIACPLPDSDGDGLADALEASLGTKRFDRDTDDDGLGDGREYLRLHTNPLRADTDRDRLDDRPELVKYRTDPRKRDTDRDRLRDGDEVRKYRTNPRKKDTDRDGVSDGVEVRRGTNPLRR